MLASVTLRNVRAFSRKDWKFGFGNLTALCGANSAGKSTVIKTLLFLRANFQSSSEIDVAKMGRVQFSGANFDLGDFRSFVSGNNVHSKISISVESTGTLKFNKRIIDHFFKQSEPSKDNLDLPYTLKSEFLFRYVAASLRSHSRHRQTGGDDPGFAVLDTATFSLFVRNECVGQFVVGLTNLARRNFPADSRPDQEIPYNCKLSREFFDITEGHKRVRPDRISRDGKFAEFFPMLGGILPTGIFAYSADEPSDVGESGVDDAKSRRMLISVPPYFRSAIEDLKDDFSSLEYIAPVRASAKRFYILNQEYESGSDGAGEAIPYLLRDNIRSRSLFPVPEGKKASSMTFSDALNIWLNFFRCGGEERLRRSELSIDFYRGLIADIKLRNSKGEAFPLADNGFGYSQLLPILVKGLLLRREGTLIVEQPELHLHPALQIRLADFFAALILSGRRVLLETHSEHMINALRVRGVEAESSALSDGMKILFLDWKGRRPEVSDLMVAPDGAIPNLPPSFFGEAMSLAGRLLRAQKHRREALSKKAGS